MSDSIHWSGVQYTNSSGNKLELGWWTYVGHSSATATVTASFWVRTYSTVDDPSVGWSINGGGMSASGGHAIHHRYHAWDATNVGYADAIVGRPYGSQLAVTFTGATSDWADFEGSYSLEQTVMVDPRSYSVPDPPTNAAVTRNSDVSHTVSWVNHATPLNEAKPYTTISVDRRQLNSSWLSIADLPGDAQVYTDLTTCANRQYQYRINAGNPTGYSTGADTPWSTTTPAAPSAPIATRAVVNIGLTWTVNASYTTAQTEVWESQDGGAYALLDTIQTDNATGYTHVNPSTTVSHTYKVRTITEDPLYSAFSPLSNTILPLAPPNAPTNLAPSTIFDAAEAVAFTWKHNAVDGTAQTAYELQHRAVGSGTWVGTGKVTGGVSSHTFAANTFTNGVVLHEWNVKTWGQHATGGAFSATTSVLPSPRPTISISYPTENAVHGTASLTAEWGYYEATDTPQSQYSIALYDAGWNPLEYCEGSGVGLVADFTTVLQNFTAYGVRGVVTDTQGQSSIVQQVSFTVEYAPPARPDVVVQFNEDSGSVTIQLTDTIPLEGEVDSNSFYDVLRSVDGGATWATLGTGMPAGIITDHIPLLGGDNIYRVMAKSAIGTSAFAPDVTLAIDGLRSGWVWINGGPGFGTAVNIRWDVDLKFRYVRSKTLHQFDGQDFPTEYRGEGRMHTATISAALFESALTDEQLYDIGDLQAPLCYRDGTGRRYFVSISNMDITDGAQAFREMSCSISRVSHEES